MSSSASMSQSTGSAPTSLQVGRVVGVADQPAGAVAAVRQEPQQPQPDLAVPTCHHNIHAQDATPAAAPPHGPAIPSASSR